MLAVHAFGALATLGFTSRSWVSACPPTLSDMLQFIMTVLALAVISYVSRPPVAWEPKSYVPAGPRLLVTCFSSL